MEPSVLKFMQPSTKVCNRCENEKPLEDFYRHKKCTGGYMHQCKECMKAHANSRRQSPEAKELARDNFLRRTYGITAEDYDVMYADQDGSCAICKTHQLELDRTLFVDHCHETGNVRGLLCSQCNSGLGMFKDNTQALLDAVEYLEKN